MNENGAVVTLHRSCACSVVCLYSLFLLGLNAILVELPFWGLKRLSDQTNKNVVPTWIVVINTSEQA